MKKKKIHKILCLLDGITKSEWDLLKGQIDLLYRVQSMEWRLKVGSASADSFGDMTYKLMNLGEANG